VFPFAGGPTLEFVIHLVTDPARFINGFLHGENKAWDGLIGEVVEADFFKQGGAYSITAAWFAQIRMSFPCMNEDHSNFRGVPIPLSDHLCGGSELFRGPRDRRGRT
jgi:hypothetical protein